MSKIAPKISVIVPIYNVEKYLSLCINSILAQTFKDFELILIDDCSTDKTLEVAKSFSDSRIRLLQNEKNLGMPGAVRNVGLDVARGEYVYFCDSDDAILANALEVLFKAAEENNANVVNTTRWLIAQDSEFNNLSSIPVRLMAFTPPQPVSTDLKQRIFQEFLQNRMHISPWIFLYKRKFLPENKIKFPAEVAEDIFFNFDVVCATSKIMKIDVPFYVYRPNSISVSHNPVRTQKNMKSIPVLCRHIEEKLAPLNDENFTRTVVAFWTAHVTNSHIVPFMQGGEAEVADEILKALEVHFGKDSLFVFTLLQFYFQGRIAARENPILKVNLNKVTQENKSLKEKLEQIDKILKG